MAANIENVLEEIDEKLLTCKICEQLYDLQVRVPRILPCHHSLCGACIARLREQGTNACPFCRKFTRMSEAFPEDTTRADLLNYKEALQQMVMSLRSRQDTCQKHQGKELEFFCTTCKSALCSECAFVEHGNRSGHDIVKLGDVLEQAKGEIAAHTKELDKIQESSLQPRAKMAATSLQETEASFKAAKKKIEAIFEKASKVLIDRKAQAMEELSSKWKEDGMELEEQAAISESLVSSAKTSTALGRTVSAVGLPSHIMAQEQKLERAVQDARAEGKKPLLLLSYKVDTDVSGLVKSLEKLGSSQSVRGQLRKSKPAEQQAKQTKTVTSQSTDVPSTPTVTSSAILTPKFQMEQSRCRVGCTLSGGGSTLENRCRTQAGSSEQSDPRAFSFLGSCGFVSLSQPAVYYWAITLQVSDEVTGDRCEFGLASLQNLDTCRKEQRISDHDIDSATLVLVGDEDKAHLEGRNWSRHLDPPHPGQRRDITYACLWRGEMPFRYLMLGFLYDNRQPQSPRVLVVETESYSLLGVRHLSPSPDLRPVLRVWPTKDERGQADVFLRARTGRSILDESEVRCLESLLRRMDR